MTQARQDLNLEFEAILATPEFKEHVEPLLVKYAGFGNSITDPQVFNAWVAAGFAWARHFGEVEGFGFVWVYQYWKRKRDSQ